MPRKSGASVPCKSLFLSGKSSQARASDQISGGVYKFFLQHKSCLTVTKSANATTVVAGRTSMKEDGHF